MDWDLRTIRAFVEIASDLSFTHAAYRVGVTQPQLSVRLRNLEQQLGFPLFERSTRRVRLTAQGEALLPVARRLLDEAAAFDQSADDIRFGLGHRVRIGAVGYFEPLRRALLQDFMARHESVGVEVEVVKSAAEAVDQLLAGRLNLAFLLDPTPEGLSPKVEALLLARETAGVLLPEGSSLAGKAEVSAEDLAGREVALFRRELCPPLHDEFVRRLAPVGARFVLLHEASENGLLEAVRHRGIAAACVRWWQAPAHRPDGVAHRALAGAALDMSCLLVRPRAPASPPAEAFWRLAERRRMGELA